MAKQNNRINTQAELVAELSRLISDINWAHDRARDMALLDFESLQDLRRAAGQIGLAADRCQFTTEDD